MIIKFTNYADGVHNLNFEESADKLGLSEEFVGNVTADVKMDKSVHQIVLNIELTVTAKLECDRCTKEFTKDFTRDFSLVYLFEHNEKKEDDTEVHFLDPDEDKINIAPDVKDYAYLTLPMKKLCDDECKGLCSHCGKDLNEGDCNCGEETINPVWEPLLKLKGKLDNK